MTPEEREKKRKRQASPTRRRPRREYTTKYQDVYNRLATMKRSDQVVLKVPKGMERASFIRAISATLKARRDKGTIRRDYKFRTRQFDGTPIPPRRVLVIRV